MRALSFRQLRAVLAVNRLGQVSAAARALGLTAPAVTLQVQQAESAAQTALFSRGAGGFRPTDAGEAMVAAARDIERRLDLLVEQIAAIRGGEAGLLRLGAVSTAKYFAPRLIAAFGADHPAIEVPLMIGNRASIIAALRDREIDLALMGRPPRQMPLSSSLLGDHPLVIIAAPDHPLAGAMTISKRRIAEERFLVREPGSGTRQSFELFLAEFPDRFEQPGAEFSSNETIKQAVMARMGIAFLSAHTIAMEIEVGRLVVLDVVGTPVRRHWFAVGRADGAPSPAVAAFRAFLAKQGKALLPSLPGLAVAP